MTLRHSLAALAALSTALVLAPGAQAHRMWIVPSATVLSGDDPWVTVDAAISNDLFYADHMPMPLTALSVTGPDGAKVAVQNGATGKYRSTFDLQLSQPGTYKIANAGGGVMASYELNGETKRWRGQKAELATAIPAGATKLRVTENQRRAETFVTRGAPSLGAFKPTGVGLEMQPITHPNDLFAGEAAKFRLLMDGKPAPNLDVKVLSGAQRYRKAAQEQTVKTGADGVFTVTWPEAGMYWIEATVRSPGGATGATGPGEGRGVSYVATLEVLNN